MKEYYKIKKVSNSSLSWFQKSPKYFKAMFDKEIEEEKQSYFEKGSITHMYVLEPDEFDKKYTFFDYEQPKSAQQTSFCEKYARLKKGTDEEKLLKAYRDSYTTKESDEKILDKALELKKTYESYIKFIKLSPMYTEVLSSSMQRQLNDVKVAILNHDKARELMFNEQHLTFGNTDNLYIQNEFEIYWELPMYKSLSFKSAIDRIIIDHEHKKVILVDLKTTSHLSEFKDKFWEYKYYRQVAFYWMAIMYYFQNNFTDKNFDEYEKETYIVAANTKDLVEVEVFEVTEPTLIAGMNEIIELCNKLDWHFENDKWDHSKEYYEGKMVNRL